MQENNQTTPNTWEKSCRSLIMIFFPTFSAVWFLIGSCCNRLLCDLPLYECLADDTLLKESPDFLPKGSISTSFKAWRTEQNSFMVKSHIWSPSNVADFRLILRSQMMQNNYMCFNLSLFFLQTSHFLMNVGYTFWIN